MMSLMKATAVKVLPLTAGVDVIANTQKTVLELASAIGVCYVVMTMIKNMGGGKKIALIGGLVLGVFVLAAIGSLDTLTDWFKQAWTATTGLPWK